MNSNESILNNPALAESAADSLWSQGIRSGDRTIIELQYAYSVPETDVICAILAERERKANAWLHSQKSDT